MKTLPKQFTKGGMTFDQVLRQGNVAIYRQSRAGQTWEAFEVGRIRQNQAREVFGKQFEAAESWPSSEEWGIRAWTFGTLARAKQRAFEMIGNEE